MPTFEVATVQQNAQAKTRLERSATIDADDEPQALLKALLHVDTRTNGPIVHIHIFRS